MNGTHEATDAIGVRSRQSVDAATALAFRASVVLIALGGVALVWLAFEGVGVWGLDNPVGSAIDLSTFAIWVGVAAAGTLAPVVFSRFRPGAGATIHRAAGATALAALVCAASYPIVHLGRPWLAYWILPLPNQMDVWPQLGSPLIWCVLALAVHAAASALYFFGAATPTFAAQGGGAPAGRILSGAAALAALALVVTAAANFSAAQRPDWGATPISPFFVAGTLFAGCAVLVALLRWAPVAARGASEACVELLWLLGTALGGALLLEIALAGFSGGFIERLAERHRGLGPAAWGYWMLVAGLVLLPQLLRAARFRSSRAWLVGLSLFFAIGFWFERLASLVAVLDHDFLPSTWSRFRPTVWDVATLLGSLGLFFALFLLFLRRLPTGEAAATRTDPHRDAPVAS